MAEELTITITAKDGASRVFKEVGTAAKSAGDSIEQAGRDGEQGFKRVGDAANRAEKEVRDVGESAQRTRTDFDALGAAMVTVGAGLAAAGQSAMRQEQLIIGLRRAYGDAADEILAFAQELDDLTIFTDDDIMAGERFFATLRNNYGFTIEQIKEVARITADLATASNVSYEDAANRVTAALRGEAEAAEYLGLTMNQQAIDRENLTLSMTNQEAALFRLNALREQSAVYEGTAADVANSSIGTYRNLTDTIEDMAQAAGHVIGPMGSMIGGIGLGVSGVVQMAGGMRTLGTAIRTAAVASRAFVASPLGLAVTAVAGAVALASIAFGRHRDDTEEAAQAYEDLQQAIQTTDDTVRNLNLSGDFGLAARLRRDIDDARMVLDGFEKDMSRVLDISNLDLDAEGAATQFRNFLDTAIGQQLLEFAAGEGWFDPESTGLDLRAQDWLTQISLGNEEAIRGAMPILRSAAADYYAEMQMTDSDRAEIEAAMQPLFDLYSNPNINVDRLDAEMERIFDRFRQTGDIDELRDSLQYLFADITTGADAFDILNTEIEGMTRAQREWKHELDDLRLDGQHELADTLERTNGLFLDLSETQLVNADTAGLYAEAQERINDAIRDGTVDGDKMNAYLRGQQTLLDLGIITYQEYAQNVIAAADNLPKFAAAADDANAALLDMGSAGDLASTGLLNTVTALDEAQAAADAARETFADLGSTASQVATEDLEAFAAAMEEIATAGMAGGLEAINEAQQATEDWIATMREVAGLDSPLATLDMTSLSTDAMAFARYVQVGNSALENTFRIVVGNTNAMGQTVQATADWIDELAYAEDGWTKINQLQADGFINEQQMNAVFEARTSILEDNAHVQNDILTMQALQAPLMADLVSQQRDYIHELSNQSAEQQLVALGWMDSATAAQAYTIVTQGATVATGEMGAAGRAAFEDMVQGAIAMNPVLEQVLTDIGLVARDHEGNITFNYDGLEGANSEIKMLTESILMLVDVLDDGELNGSVSLDTLEAQQQADDLVAKLSELDGQDAEVSVTGDGSAAEDMLRNVLDAIGMLDGTTATVHAEGENDGAVSAVLGAHAALDGLSGRSVMTYQQGDNSGALGAVAGAAAALAGLDGDTATVYINAVNNAGAAIGAVASQLASLDGRSATVTTNYVTSYSTVGIPNPFQHGGIPALDTGGIVPFWGAEAGPEVAHFAGGGTAVLPFEGVYGAPHGTYISPANANPGPLGGIHISVPIYGGTFYGMDDITEQVTRQLAPEIRAVAEDIRASQMRVN